MAFANSFGSVEHGLVDRLSHLMGSLVEKQRRRKVYRETIKELNALTGRELSDLGISRSAIRSVAFEAAYGAK